MLIGNFDVFFSWSVFPSLAAFGSQRSLQQTWRKQPAVSRTLFSLNITWKAASKLSVLCRDEFWGRYWHTFIPQTGVAKGRSTVCFADCSWSQMMSFFRLLSLSFGSGTCVFPFLGSFFRVMVTKHIAQASKWAPLPGGFRQDCGEDWWCLCRSVHGPLTPPISTNHTF